MGPAEMGMFRLFFFGALAFIAGVAIFIGGVMMITSLQNGMIGISYTSGGKAVTETISRTADNARFWRLMVTMGVMPFVIGSAVLWLSVRKLRGK
jgi:hypothetical protein